MKGCFLVLVFMGRVFDSVCGLIGGTPLLRLANFEKNNNLETSIFAKVELFNPAGSIKDRAALEMINDYEARGLLSADSVIIEPTSGNTGIGLAAVCASRGYRLIIVMPDSMSRERQLLMRAYGAELILTDGKLGMKGAIERAEELSRELDGAFLAGQFVNPENPHAHYLTTGPEIYCDTDGDVDILVSGVGTGGTITGTARYLKERKSTVRAVAVEPMSSAVLSGEAPGPHGLQGIGAGFIPEVLDTSLIDEIIKVSEQEAYAAARQLGAVEGILVGISSGAALSAAIKLAKLSENKGKTIVVILPDTGERYLSTSLFKNS